MNEWALLRDGQIIDVITTVSAKSEVQKQYPQCEVADLHSLSDATQKAYRYWNERP